MSRDRQRRRVVKLIGVGTVAAVAGCRGSDDNQDDSNGNSDDAKNGSNGVSGSGEPDGDHYTVVMGRCHLESRDPEDGQYVDPDQEPSDGLEDLPVEGTTTIDGEEVYVFDDAGETKYVSAETDYP